MYRGSYTLIGAELSMFTRKLEAQLRYQQVPHQWQFKTVELGPSLEQRAGTRFIPLLETPDGWLINDTIAIGPMLSDRFSAVPVVPTAPEQRATCFVLEDYFNHWLPRHALHSRWVDLDNAITVGRWFGANMLLGKSVEEPLSDEEFATVSNMGTMMRDSFGLGACDVQGAGAERAAEVKEDFQAIMAMVCRHLGAHPFLLGNKACLADFALVGPIKAHFLQDPVPRRWLEEQGCQQVLSDYVERVYAGEQHDAAYLADGNIPDTLMPLLRHAVSHYQPFAQASISAAMRGDKTFSIDLGKGEFTARSMKRLEKARQHVRDELQGLALAGSALERSGALSLYMPPTFTP